VVPLCRTLYVGSLPFPPLHFPSLLSPSLRSRPPVRRSGERYKLSQQGLGQSPSRNRMWCILAFNMTSVLVATVLLIFQLTNFVQLTLKCIKEWNAHLWSTARFSTTVKLSEVKNTHFISTFRGPATPLHSP